MDLAHQQPKYDAEKEVWACILRDDICVQLVMPMPIMIWLAVIVEAAIANWLDMIILLLIQFINASIGWYGQPVQPPVHCVDGHGIPDVPSSHRSHLMACAKSHCPTLLKHMQLPWYGVLRIMSSLSTLVHCSCICFSISPLLHCERQCTLRTNIDAMAMRSASMYCRYETTKAGDAVKALKASLKPQATVCRDGKWQSVDAALLVPGDLVLLGSGSHIPADCRVGSGLLHCSLAMPLAIGMRVLVIVDCEFGGPQ